MKQKVVYVDGHWRIVLQYEFLGYLRETIVPVRYETREEAVKAIEQLKFAKRKRGIKHDQHICSERKD